MDNLYHYGKGTPEQYEDIIDFADMVFQINFRPLLPKLYRNHPECAAHHHVVMEGDRIKGVVGSFPITLIADEKPIKVRGIGTVSVHSTARSKGYMKICMNGAVEEARKEGTDLMVLSGRRKRYEYFGFARCGTSYSFSMDQATCHHWKSVSREAFSIVPLEEHPEYIAECLQLFRKQAFHAARTEENFLDVTKSWEATPYVIRENGAFFGYFSIDSAKKDRVQELVLADDTKTAAVCFKIIEEMKRGISFSVLFSQTEMIHSLHPICENMSIDVGPMFYVINYKHVIEAFLGLKSRLTGICDGSYVIDVSEVGKYEISVKDGVVSVVDTKKAADKTLSHIEMSNFLFSPLGQLGGGKKSEIEKSWFPIPLSIFYCDNV